MALSVTDVTTHQSSTSTSTSTPGSTTLVALYCRVLCDRARCLTVLAAALASPGVPAPPSADLQRSGSKSAVHTFARRVGF